MSIKHSRVVSITFDDGLKNSTDTAISILGKYGLPATFYVVTGWVAPQRIDIKEPFNIGRAHGTWAYWREVSAMGHEVGSHSYSHLNARGRKALLFPWLVPNEITRSHADLQREVPQTSHSMAMPWNAATWYSEFFVRRAFSACRLGTPSVKYNDLSSLAPYRLESWAPSSKDGWAEYISAINDIPDGGWLIFQFHGFGNEGWDPITPELFDRLCEYVSKSKLIVANVREVIERCGF